MAKLLRVSLALAALLIAVYFLLGRHRSEPIPVELSASAQQEGNALHLSGDTNLPDGAIILYELSHEHPESPLHQGRFVVEDGHFGGQIDLPTGLDEDATVQLSFQVVMDDGSQPADLIDRFGAFGENMTGELVAEGELGKRAVLTVPVETGD